MRPSPAKVALTIAGLFLFFCYMQMRPVWRNLRTDREQTIGAVDAVGRDRIVQAARTFLQEHSNLADKRGSISIDRVEIPDPIRQLHPLSINTARDRFMFVKVKKRRGYVVCFAEGIPEFGTIQLTNGLWFWNGIPSPATREVYERSLRGQPGQ